MRHFFVVRRGFASFTRDVGDQYNFVHHEVNERDSLPIDSPCFQAGERMLRRLRLCEVWRRENMFCAKGCHSCSNDEKRQARDVSGAKQRRMREGESKKMRVYLPLPRLATAARHSVPSECKLL